MARAQKNGETGMNGEFYKGGQFLPNTTLSKMEKRSRKSGKPRKAEVAPYTWEIVPEGKISIYSIFAGVWGKVINGKMVVTCSDQTLNYYRYTRQEVEELATKWNNGERWIERK